MSDDAWDTLREDVADRLPALIDRALAVYAGFAAADPPADARAFAAFQASCRAALAHLHLLIRLSDWARAGGALAADTDADIARLIEAADEAIDRFDPD